MDIFFTSGEVLKYKRDRLYDQESVLEDLLNDTRERLEELNDIVFANQLWEAILECPDNHRICVKSLSLGGDEYRNFIFAVMPGMTDTFENVYLDHDRGDHDWLKVSGVFRWDGASWFKCIPNWIKN